MWIWILFAGLVIGKWQDTVELLKTEDSIVFHTEYFNKQSQTTHIVFYHKKNDKYSLSYMSWKKTGDVSKPVLIAENIPETGQKVAKITGMPDGKHLYIAFISKRDPGVYDVFFVKSKDEGMTWTKPALCRSNNLKDNQERILLEFMMLESGRLFVFYKQKGKNLVFSSLSPSSEVWNNEKEIKQKFCTNTDSVNGLSGAEYFLSKYQHTVILSFGCQIGTEMQAIVLESTNYGLNWIGYLNTHFDLSKNSSPLLTTRLVQKSNIYGALSETREKGAFELGTVYQYSTGGIYKEILAKLLEKIEHHKLDLFVYNSVVYLIYFATESKYDSAKTLLKFIPTEEIYKQSSLEVPTFEKGTMFVSVLCLENQLAAIGIRASNSIIAQKYDFS